MPIGYFVEHKLANGNFQEIREIGNTGSNSHRADIYDRGIITASRIVILLLLEIW